MMNTRTIAWIAGGGLALGVLLLLFGPLVAGLALAPVAGPDQPWPWTPHMWGWAGGWPFMLVMMLGMLLFWVAVIVGLVALVRSLVGPGDGSAGPDQALDILRQRYARGEIDREEFEARRRDLEQGG